MANIKNFCGDIQLFSCTAMPNDEFKAKFPGVRGIRYDGYSKWVGKAPGGASYLPVERSITYKSQPSRHKCNAKCLGGKFNGTCECQCGGKNHGRGMFTNLLVA